CSLLVSSLKSPTRGKDYCLLIPSQSRVLCREEQLLLRFFGGGSRQLKLFRASLTLQGVECVDPTFSRSRIKRRGQREKVAISNRLPRFRIRACSALVWSCSGTVLLVCFRRGGWEKRLVSVNSFSTARFVSRKYF